MIIDCDACAVRGLECGDCVVTVMLGMPPVRGAAPEVPDAVELDAREQAAIAVLAQCGLIPPLRLVPTDDEFGLPGGDADGPNAAPERRRAAG